MLQNIRSWSETYLAKILMAVMMGCFALFFGLSDFGGGGIGYQPVATVGGQAISGEMLRRPVEGRIQAISSNLGGTTISPAQAQQFGVIDYELNRLISDRLTLADVDRLELTVGDAVVKQLITGYDQSFQDGTGRFNPARFRAVARSLGLSENEMFEAKRQEVGRTMLVDVLNRSASPPPSMVQRVANYQAEQRSGEAVIIPLAVIPEQAPDEPAARAQYDKNPSAYQHPEYRQGVMARIDAAEIAKALEPAEERVRESYEERKEEFAVPERRSASHYVGDQKTAELIARDTASGKPFADTVQAHSNSALIDLAESDRHGFLPTLAEHIFNQAEGVVSKPFQSPAGWHVAQTTRIVPAIEPSFDAARDTLSRDLAAVEADKIAREISEDLIDALAGGETIEEAGRRLGAEIIAIGPVDRVGNGKDGKKIETLPDNEAVVRELFTLENINEQSGRFETKSGGLIELRLDRIIKPTTKEFAEVRADLLSEQANAKRATVLEEKGKQIVQRVNRGETLDSIASQENLSIIRIPATNRRDGTNPRRLASNNDNPLIREIQAEMFADDRHTAADSSPNAVSQVQLITLQRGQMIAVLRFSREVGKATKAEKEQVASTMQAAMAADLIGAYTEDLRGIFQVEINQDAINQLFSIGQSDE